MPETSTGQRKKIVILGAGFAGLQVALFLAKHLQNPAYEIVLVDERNIHLYTPDLYEIATAFHEKITEECLTQLKDTVAISLTKIIASKKIRLLCDKAVKIHAKSKTLELKNLGAVTFDYLILTLGSVVNYYHIPGLAQFSYPLKTLTDSLAINCHLDIYFQTLWKQNLKKRISIIVGGGGATGVEAACELPRYIDKLCKKYTYPRDRVDITIIEGSAQFTGQGEKVTTVIVARFKKLGIQPLLNTLIKDVGANFVTVESQKNSSTLNMDILIWTGGVMPHPLIKESFSLVAQDGALPVNAFLQYEKFPFIFAGGDNAYFLDQMNGKIAPMLAQIAFQQGKIIGRNIVAEIQTKPKKPYTLRVKGVIIPLGGEYALLKKGNFVFKGFFIWVMRRLVDLAYALSILPFSYAIRKWIHDTNIFVGNDSREP